MQKALIASIGGALLVFLASAPSAQKGKPQTTPIRWEVVDANGLVVGVSAGLDVSEAQVLVSDGSRDFQVRVVAGGWFGIGATGMRLYKSPGCSGDVWIPVPSGGTLGILTDGHYEPASFELNKTLWVAAEGAVPQVPNAIYTMTGDPAAGDPCIRTYDTTGSLMVPGIPTTLMAAFEAPFRVRAVR